MSFSVLPLFKDFVESGTWDSITISEIDTFEKLNKWIRFGRYT
jgi:hypothetical protein